MRGCPAGAPGAGVQIDLPGGPEHMGLPTARQPGTPGAESMRRPGRPLHERSLGDRYPVPNGRPVDPPAPSGAEPRLHRTPGEPYVSLDLTRPKPDLSEPVETTTPPAAPCRLRTSCWPTSPNAVRRAVYTARILPFLVPARHLTTVAAQRTIGIAVMVRRGGLGITTEPVPLHTNRARARRPGRRRHPRAAAPGHTPPLPQQEVPG